MEHLIDDELAECQLSSFQQNMNAMTTKTRGSPVKVLSFFEFLSFINWLVCQWVFSPLFSISFHFLRSKMAYFQFCVIRSTSLARTELSELMHIEVFVCWNAMAQKNRPKNFWHPIEFDTHFELLREQCRSTSVGRSKYGTASMLTIRRNAFMMPTF